MSRRKRVALVPATTDAGAKPVLMLVPGGKLAYLWVGDETRYKFYGSVGGAKLRRFAQAILAELEPPHGD